MGNFFKQGFVICTLVFSFPLIAQHSIAREWNEVLLESIRRDLARPTVHARNLYHVSAAMYDSWAIYDNNAQTEFLGNNINGFDFPFEGFTPNEPYESAREKTISYAAYRVLSYRFLFSPSYFTSQALFDSLMNLHGYDIHFTSTDYSSGNAAAMGNYIADLIIKYGQQDGANELNDYRNRFYETTNPVLDPTKPGNPNIRDPNHWQELGLQTFVDQSGHEIVDGTRFLSAEWGNVIPFALPDREKTTFSKDGNEYQVYLDPGPPPLLDTLGTDEVNDLYKWNFELVAIWASHLNPESDTEIDISPASSGNILEYPIEQVGNQDFYDLLNGGTQNHGYEINPITNEPYTPQIVKLGDYARVIAEFWADGPDSETPPGHWFALLNYVSDNMAGKKLHGTGEVVSDLEWDIKAYLLLGGAMHDAAVVAWSIKGWYDYIRPISAIRYLADNGQSSDTTLENYHPLGIRLYPGLIETVTEDDELAGAEKENVGKIKLWTWKGHDFINDPMVDVAGVGWILAENWWPYQRPTFVTPPFAGYVSGHSTFSAAASRVLTYFTGSPYFPGGLGQYLAKKNEFLVFEDGPSEDIILQWASYQDASDETSLSRIWGGIHPPADDVTGRHLGVKVSEYAIAKSQKLFEKVILNSKNKLTFNVFPNPVDISLKELNISVSNQLSTDVSITLYDAKGSLIYHSNDIPTLGKLKIDLPEKLTSGVYQMVIQSDIQQDSKTLILK